MLFSLLYYSPQIKKYFRSSVLLSDVSGELAAARFAQGHYEYFMERKEPKFIPSDWQPRNTITVWHAEWEVLEPLNLGVTFDKPPACYKPVQIVINVMFCPVVENKKGAKNGEA